MKIHTKNIPINNSELRSYQFEEINKLLRFVSQNNLFYKEKFKNIHFPIRTLEEFHELPFTTKKELLEDQKKFPPYGRIHTYPEKEYIRMNKTSGTSGNPLKILDTTESWEWFADCWLKIYESSGISLEDRLFFAFAFGPFTGFWAAYEGGKKLGALVIPGGGQTTIERLAVMMEQQATVLLCTPSYALHLAEVAEQNGINIKDSFIRAIITAGEPGGSIPSVRQHIENLWNAKVYDHLGASEVGSYGYSCLEQSGVHVNETQFYVEIINPKTLEKVKDGERGELVVTNFGRYGYPIIRYRTGDMVIKSENVCPCGDQHQLLPSGIIGRVDDMVVVRGVNIFPQSIEAIIREFPVVQEFRIVYYTKDNMNQVKVQLEAKTADKLQDLKNKLREKIGIRIDVETVPLGTLPRFELKARRVVDERNSRGM